MNKKKSRASVGNWVRLRPRALRHDGQTWLPQLDDDWAVRRVNSDGTMELQNIRTGHYLVLGRDHVHGFDSDPMNTQYGLKHGFLHVWARVILMGSRTIIEPIPPSERRSLVSTPL